MSSKKNSRTVGSALRAKLLSLRDYVRLAAPEPEVLKTIGCESKENGTDCLSSREIDQIIRMTRARKRKR
jgi:hypothetical protein